MPYLGFECRLAVLLIVFGFMFQDFMAGGSHPRAAWEPPIVWVPAVLVPVIALGGGLEGTVLGEAAGGLARRTPWHALRFIVSERRRAAAARERQETKPFEGRGRRR